MRIGSASTVIFLAEVLFVWATASFAQTVSFGPITSFPIAGNPRAVAVGDFNEDGKLDLAVGTFDDSHAVSVLLGNDTDSFGPATNFAVDGAVTSVAVGDFNRDGKEDLVVLL